MKSIKDLETELFVESLHKLQSKIVIAVLTLRLERDTHVPDLMTRIRILPGVAVVGQRDRVDRFSDGDTKLLPRTEDIYKNLEYLSKMIRKLPGVLTIAVDEYNKRRITSKGQKIVF